MLLDNKTILITGGTGSFGKCFTKYMKTCEDKNKSSLENYFATEFVEEYSQYVDLLTGIFLKQITCKQDKG